MNDTVITPEARDGLIEQMTPFAVRAVSRLISIWPSRYWDIVSEAKLQLVLAYQRWLELKSQGKTGPDEEFFVFARTWIRHNTHRMIKRDHLVVIPEEEYRDNWRVIIEPEAQPDYNEVWYSFLDSLDILADPGSDPNVPRVFDHPAAELLDAVDSIGLDSRERTIVLYRLAGANNREIALKLGYTEARISQLLSAIQQKARQAGLRPVERRVAVSDAKKTCIGCNAELSLDSFYVQRKNPLQYFARCRGCMKTQRDAKRL